MTVYSSPTYSLNQPTPMHGDAGSVQRQYAIVTTTAALTTADTFNFFYLPPNARIAGGLLKASDLDTNGTPTVVLKIGDAGDDDRYFTASTVAQTGTFTNTLAATGVFYKTTAKTLVTGGVSTNAATGVAGTIELSLSYVVEDSPTSGS